MQNDTISELLNNLKDPASLEVRKKIDMVSGLGTNVLFFGETGTGKDFWANYLFQKSGKENILNLNCGDIPENLLESEWFGYKKGAFTGADKDYEGKWKMAEHGILFLNQIDLLGLNMQARLLRIIERKKYFPLGSPLEIGLNARFIFSTDSDIEDKVRSGGFRQDLFYRISSYSLFIPPLRERKGDILPLLEYFSKKKNLALNLTKAGAGKLTDYSWPGNIREIENFVNSLSIIKDSIEDVDADHLSIRFEENFETDKSKEYTLREMEQRYIKYLLNKHKNKSKVAGILGISRKSLYDKLERYDKN